MFSFRKQLCSNDFFQINTWGKTYNFNATYLFEFEMIDDDRITISFDYGKNNVKILRLIILNDKGRVLKKFDCGLKNWYNSWLNYCSNKNENIYDHTTISLTKGKYFIKYWDNSGSDMLYHIDIKTTKLNIIDLRSNLCDRQRHSNGFSRLSPFENTKDKKEDDEHFKHRGKRDHMSII